MIEVILDTETTGLSADKDRIVEIACIELSNHIPTKNIFHTFINPETKVSADAFSVHGYSDEFLSNKPKFKEIVKNFLDFIKDKKLVIHNADFDLGFLNNELRRLNVKPILKSDVVDTLQIARSKFPGVGNSLDALCKRYKINVEAREKHSALVDCHLLSKVYIELIDKKELTLDLELSNKGNNDQMRLNNENRQGIIVPISPEKVEEYKKFLKKNVPNAFALD
ncbi:MAG: DNA polymerase III subunit epsilon [Candidatus Fonsibacter ubiquis]|jgi:DNA polymerase-3 subunit epsilon|nr:DNA polymerase III subunit epsilon [Candidatus Fonsibacter ubiquis]NCU55729.1 DNA polymerase III subunit epsilon [Candidatus Fonsibacter ubiquis]NCU75253.1 DNA polymerase III subunit epsilon [Candidatus Fonsibacter ubiquis]HRD24536.1 DNA polymerase III subunit epsilon [Candidatus Fonsibacter ubiquis]